ncbi:MAG: MnhB domain-containing protein [Candidatus Omnitrophica bacterium]|nr:MnhB domain-containing protein [Candidatus Omnitrophota bacterium]
MKNDTAGMSVIVKTITRLTVGLILIYGIYIVLQGHIGPGGGFAGGVIVALSLIHLMLAFGKEEVLAKFNKARGLFLTSFAAVIFLLISTLKFMARQKASVGIVPLSDIVISGMVGAGLFVIFLTLVLFIKDSLEGVEK